MNKEPLLDAIDLSYIGDCPTILNFFETFKIKD